LVTPSSFIPLPLKKGKGEWICKRGFASLYSPFSISLPERRGTGYATGAKSLFDVLCFELVSLGSLREASAPLPQPPPLLDKERGTQGVRSPNKNTGGQGDRSPNTLCPEFTIAVAVL